MNKYQCPYDKAVICHREEWDRDCDKCPFKGGIGIIPVDKSKIGE